MEYFFTKKVISPYGTSRFLAIRRYRKNRILSIDKVLISMLTAITTTLHCFKSSYKHTFITLIQNIACFEFHLSHLQCLLALHF